jgi:hypothetical protein
MTVYVDDMKAKLGRMTMCHMLADSDEELLAMAHKIGVPLHHHQFPGTPKSHFDICMQKKALAIAAGAVQITMKDAGRIIKRRREASDGSADIQAGS